VNTISERKNITSFGSMMPLMKASKWVMKLKLASASTTQTGEDRVEGRAEDAPAEEQQDDADQDAEHKAESPGSWSGPR